MGAIRLGLRSGLGRSLEFSGSNAENDALKFDMARFDFPGGILDGLFEIQMTVRADLAKSIFN